MKKTSILVLLLLACAAISSSAQTTEFTFQGRLLDNTLPATGTYDMQFRLWTSDTGGGGGGFGVETRPNVAVSQGIFTVVLDFGNLFTGPERWIEISIRPAGSSEQYLTLAGRQRITSTPYSIKSLNSDTATTATNSSQLGGVPASEYVVTTDPRMTNERAPSPGSGNYVQNTTGQQGASNFHISGTGRANILGVNTQFNLGTSRVLTQSNWSLFVGLGAGESDSSISTAGVTSVGNEAGRENTGSFNTFIGAFTGRTNSSGQSNTAVGHSAGFSGTTGSSNTFIGSQSGRFSTASNLTFVGAFAGQSNTSGPDNSFLGESSGRSNTTGARNSFFGIGTGRANVAANDNSFFGAFTGNANVDGWSNSFYGSFAGQFNVSGNFNSLFGARAGRNVRGLGNTLIGSDAGVQVFDGIDNTFVGKFTGINNNSGSSNTFVGSDAGQTNVGGTSNSLFGARANFVSGGLSFATAIGADATVSTSNTISLGRANGSDVVRIPGNAVVTGSSTFGGTAAFNTGTFAGSIAVANNANINGNAVVGGNGTVSNDLLVNGTLAVGGPIAAGHRFSATVPFDGISGGRMSFGLCNLISTFTLTTFPTSDPCENGGIRTVGQEMTVFPTLTGVLRLGRSNNIIVHADGFVSIVTSPGGVANLCRTVDGKVAACSSSLRYKNNVQNWQGNFAIVNRLRPVSFDWKNGDLADLGLVAEEVAEIEPLLVTYNDKGEVEGVKYDRIGVVLVNVVKEQQSQISAQQRQIDELKAVVCGLKPDAAVCTKEN